MRRRADLVFSSVFWILSSGFLLCSGCTEHHDQPTTQPAGTYERSEKALKDPFGYSPDMGNTDISGGGISDLDRDALRKDMKDVFDP
jgi:hypothetical protein